ncbi:CPBP family intramembrane metalloprotease [Leucobacter zeae]|nr:CPBP family intramembrane metalloprotease [Leucobacter zeae]
MPAPAAGPAQPARPDRFARVPWGAVATYVATAFALAWAVALPLWLMERGSATFTAWYGVIGAAVMFTPAIATLVVVLLMRTPRAERMRLLGMWPLRPAKRVVWAVVAAWLGAPAVVALSIAVAVLCGWVQLDLTGFSAFQATIDAQLSGLDPETRELAAASMPPVGVLVALQLVAIPFGALFNSIFAFGEEVGWRGWLLPALRPLGVWPALVLSGAIWGLWHTPLILLGHNFGLFDWRGVALMTGGCIAWGVLLGWARLRSGSVWPAVVGHGALNASAGVVGVFAAADGPFDPALVLPLGVAGWIAAALVVAALVLGRQFGEAHEPRLAPKRAPVAPPVSA